MDDPVDTIDFSIEAPHQRNRLRTLLRPILMLPWALIENLWSQLAVVFAIVQWFVILITGRRNEDIQSIQKAYLGFASRVYTWSGLLYDAWPSFADNEGGSGTHLSVDVETPPNRVTNFFRLILAIPGIIVALVFSAIIVVLTLVVWVVIVITGKMPPGLQSFLLKLHRFVIRLNGYLLLMTDKYPAWN
jgi:hypothetical protein